MCRIFIIIFNNVWKCDFPFYSIFTWWWERGLGAVDLVIWAVFDAIAPLLPQNAHPAGGTNARALGTRFADAGACGREHALVLRVVARRADLDLTLRHAAQGALALAAVLHLVHRPHGVVDVAHVAGAVALRHATLAVPQQLVRTCPALFPFLLGQIRTQSALGGQRGCRLHLLFSR
jgi:hypothetical protein